MAHSWVLVFIQFEHLCFSFSMLRPFIFNVIIYMVGFHLLKNILFIEYLKNDSKKIPFYLISCNFFFC